VGEHVDDDFGRIVDAWFDQADEFLLGRSTYDMMETYWTEVTDPDNAVATALNGLPKHVVSTSLTEPTWQNATVISSNVVDAVPALKDKPGRELQVHGSWQLAARTHAARRRAGRRVTACWSSPSSSAPASASSPTVPPLRRTPCSTARSPAPA
jgi:hypothetical protein